MSSLPNRRKLKKAPSNFTRKKKAPLFLGRGREHTLKKKKRWSSPRLSNKDVWSSHQPSIRNRTPPLHALKQEYSSPQVVRGKRTELLSRRELHYILVRRFAVLRKVRRPHSCRPQQCMSSLPNRRKLKKAPSNFTRKKKLLYF